MGPLGVAICHPVRKDCPGMGRATEHGIIEKLISHPSIEAFDKTVVRGFARGDVVPLDVLRGTPVEDRV